MAVNILIKAIDKRGYPFEIRAKTSVVFLRKKSLCQGSTKGILNQVERFEKTFWQLPTRTVHDGQMFPQGLHFISSIHQWNCESIRKKFTLSAVEISNILRAIISRGCKFQPRYSFRTSGWARARSSIRCPFLLLNRN